MRRFICCLSLLIGCGEEGARYYRPVGAQKTVSEQSDANAGKAVDEMADKLKYRPRFMPCSAVETRHKNNQVYQKWNWYYSYDPKGRLEYANSIEVREDKEIRNLPTDTRFWNSRYAYDDKDRLKFYQRLTDKIKYLCVSCDMQPIQFAMIF